MHDSKKWRRQEENNLLHPELEHRRKYRKKDSKDIESIKTTIKH